MRKISPLLCVGAVALLVPGASVAVLAPHATDAALAAGGCVIVGSELRVTLAESESAALSRSGTGIVVTSPSISDPSCGGATVTTIDSINILGAAGDETLKFNLTGGAFVPGATTEATQISEIELSVNLGLGDDHLEYQGGNAAETMRMGTTGIEWTADNDLDVTLAGIERATLSGGGGNDSLMTNGSTLAGSPFPGPISFFGEAGNDVLHGGAGADTFVGGGNTDTITGGAGVDTITYAHHTGSTQVDLIAGTARGEGTDSVSSVENVIGTAKNDTLRGSNAANRLVGGLGNDVINGALGADVLLGEDGSDTVDYADATGNVVLDLAAGTATGGGGADTLVGFEHALGSPFNDTILGTPAVNTIDGRAGNDTLRGFESNDAITGGSGSDTMDGGLGTDLADYRTSAVGATVDLTAGTGADDGSDTLVDFENVYGSPFDDRFTGSAIRNQLRGYGGNDTLLGMAGNDALDGGDGDDSLDGGDGNDSLIGGNGTDTCAQGAGTGVPSGCEA